MRYRDFGGKNVSVIALGSTGFGGQTPEQEALDFLDAYAEIGGNFIDTARVYGSTPERKYGESERIIGKWMETRRNRDKVFLSTKGGHPDPETMRTGRLSHGEIMDDFKRSLDNLRTDRIDIYWLHRDDESRSVGDIMETMTEIAESGGAGMIGVSNWKPIRVLEANAYARSHGIHPLDADQIQFSLARQTIVEDPTMYQMNAESYRMHLETDMPLMAFSSQAKGFFSKLADMGEAGLSPKARRRYLHPENLAIYDRILEIQRQTGLAAGSIALAWLIAQPFPVFPIVGVSRKNHLQALKEAGEAVITSKQRDYLRKM